jgi:hypothetical protein
MSLAQLRRRTDALQRQTGPADQFSFTIEQACRMLWRMDKRVCEKMAREGDRSMGFYMGQFTIEEELARGIRRKSPVRQT